MKREYRFIFVVVLFFLLAACSQDPWKAEQIQAQAEADKTRIEAEQFALNQEQNRKHAEEMQAIAVNNEQLEYERRLALEQSVREGWRMFITAVFLVGSAAVAYIIFMGTRSTVKAYEEAAQGITKALVQAADIRSRLIYLDDGRQFPAIVESSMITDITTGAVMDMTKPNPGNTQAIAGAIANRHVGIVAKETRRSQPDTASSTALSQKPPIIEAKFSDVREYYDMVMSQRRGWDDE